MMDQVLLTKFIEMYERDGVSEVVVVNGKIYGKTTEGQHGKPGKRVVYAVLP